MNITTNYLCHVVGEEPVRVERWHLSTIRRMKAFAIAIHIPVILWAVTGYVIASQIFELSRETSALVVILCAGLVYMVERLVLATPKNRYVNCGRLMIGIVMAILGACTVDLVIFDKEIAHQLRAAEGVRINAEYDRLLVSQTQIIAQNKLDWFKAQEASNCEANGTCGSRVRSVGPIYRELSRQAKVLRQEYFSAQNKLDELSEKKSLELAAASSNASREAGLLARVEALHQYISSNNAALVAWILFFSLILFFELMVVLVKLVFGETVDDQIDKIREDISRHKADVYGKTMTSPVASAQKLLEQTDC